MLRSCALAMWRIASTMETGRRTVVNPGSLVFAMMSILATPGAWSNLEKPCHDTVLTAYGRLHVAEVEFAGFRRGALRRGRAGVPVQHVVAPPSRDGHETSFCPACSEPACCGGVSQQVWM
jgi:hypothetical protein